MESTSDAERAAAGRAVDSETVRPVTVSGSVTGGVLRHPLSPAGPG